MSPATSIPGPHIDLVPEIVRWFARWLRDEPNGIDEEPPIAVFRRRSTRPAPDLTEMRGEWGSEPTWPAERGRALVLRPHGAGRDAVEIHGDVGVAAWISCAGKPPWVLPDDQRRDDERSLTYDWEPLEDGLELLGHPRLRLTLTAPSPVAFLSAKLSDVFEDGASALVSRGILNLAHRLGHGDPRPLEPGIPTAVELELEATSWIFEPGHRVRLALAGSDWPNTWPPPHGGELVVDRGSVELVLPTLVGPSPTPAPALTTPPATCEGEDADRPPVVRLVERAEDETRVVTGYGSTYEAPFGAQISERYDGSVGVSSADSARAWARATTTYRIAWPEATVATSAKLDLRSDAETYRVTIDVVAEEEGEDGIGRIERRFERTIRRRLQ